ncbi:MAG: hypothetical protein AAGJ31_04390 [Verrucomicrobiota bacterium]
MPLRRKSCLTDLDKIYLLFEEAFWDSGKSWILTLENDLPRGQFNIWVNFHKYIDLPIIMASSAGSSALALANRSDEDMVTLASQTLAKAYP